MSGWLCEPFKYYLKFVRNIQFLFNIWMNSNKEFLKTLFSYVNTMEQLNNYSIIEIKIKNIYMIIHNFKTMIIHKWKKEPFWSFIENPDLTKFNGQANYFTMTHTFLITTEKASKNRKWTQMIFKILSLWQLLSSG